MVIVTALPLSLVVVKVTNDSLMLYDTISLPVLAEVFVVIVSVLPILFVVVRVRGGALREFDAPPDAVREPLDESELAPIVWLATEPGDSCALVLCVEAGGEPKV